MSTNDLAQSSGWYVQFGSGPHNGPFDTDTLLRWIGDSASKESVRVYHHQATGGAWLNPQDVAELKSALDCGPECEPSAARQPEAEQTIEIVATARQQRGSDGRLFIYVFRQTLGIAVTSAAFFLIARQIISQEKQDLILASLGLGKNEAVSVATAPPTPPRAAAEFRRPGNATIHRHPQAGNPPGSLSLDTRRDVGALPRVQPLDASPSRDRPGLLSQHQQPNPVPRPVNQTFNSKRVDIDFSKPQQRIVLGKAPARPRTYRVTVNAPERSVLDNPDGQLSRDRWFDIRFPDANVTIRLKADQVDGNDELHVKHYAANGQQFSQAAMDKRLDGYQESLRLAEQHEKNLEAQKDQAVAWLSTQVRRGFTRAEIVRQKEVLRDRLYYRMIPDARKRVSKLRTEYEDLRQVNFRIQAVASGSIEVRAVED